jgi:hypothetical protein
MTFIINSIFAGTFGLTAALLVVQLMGFELNFKLNMIRAISITLLIGSVAYLLQMALYAPSIYNQFNSVGHLLLFMVWPVVFSILPQLLWFKKLRERLGSLLVLVGIWAITLCFVPWLLPQAVINLVQQPNSLIDYTSFSWINYLEVIGTYAGIFLVVYGIIYRYRKPAIVRAIPEPAHLADIA